MEPLWQRPAVVDDQQVALLQDVRQLVESPVGRQCVVGGDQQADLIGPQAAGLRRGGAADPPRDRGARATRRGQIQQGDRRGTLHQQADRQVSRQLDPRGALLAKGPRWHGPFRPATPLPLRSDAAVFVLRAGLSSRSIQARVRLQTPADSPFAEWFPPFRCAGPGGPRYLGCPSV